MMFELDEEDLEEDYVGVVPPDKMVAMITHELQDTDYESPNIEVEVCFPANVCEACYSGAENMKRLLISLSFEYR